MRTIYHYEIEQGSKSIIEMPKGAEIITVENRLDTIAVYALVDREAPKEEETFSAIGTGWDVSDEFLLNNFYVGTVRIGSLVWHVFKEIKPEPKQANGDCPVCGGVREDTDPNQLPYFVDCTQCSLKVEAHEDFTTITLNGHSFVLDKNAGEETNMATILAFEEMALKVRAELP